MSSAASPNHPVSRPESFWAFWAVFAAFGTYFCMYGFRKPFTVAEYDGTMVGNIDFKTIVVSIQVLGYMLSKFIGIKIISEMPPQRRAFALIGLILAAEAALALFGVMPRPWNAVGLFLNGLCLGMVFGLVLGFLEGRRLTEALVAGLCTSFILADGVTKSVGAWLLAQGVPEDWMPFTAGLIFLLPLCGCVGMLTKVPAPSAKDIVARSARETMTSHDRWSLFHRYALGLSILVGIYLLITIIRSIRADFAAELWGDLGKDAAPSIFTRSEMWVAFGVMFVNGLSIYIRNNRVAFFLSLGTCALGLIVVAVALIGQQTQSIGAFQFMVLIGFGLYLPYVAIHTTVFERLLAMTRERGNLGFLMYLADAFGYLGYVLLMFTRNFFVGRENFLEFFISVCWLALGISLVALFIACIYFANHGRQSTAASAVAEQG